MYAIVKTGGKQYTVAPGDYVDVEKIDAEEGKTVELPAICIVDGDKVIADPAKAASTKVVASVVKQFKGKKQIVFKFKKRKNYKKLNGHRQKLTTLHIESVGSEKAPVKPAKTSAAAKTTAAAKSTTEAKPAKKATASKSTKSAAKTTAKKTATKKTTAAKATSSKSTASKAKTAAKKPSTAKKSPAKKTASKSTKSAAKTTKSAAAQK